MAAFTNKIFLASKKKLQRLEK